jgi:hypothetical protein
MMKGMSLGEYVTVIEFAQKYHKFALLMSEEEVKERNKKFFQMHGEFKSYGMNIKYIDCCYDSRDQTVWSISFRKGNGGIRFSTNHFAGHESPKDWKYNSLFDLCMAFLKGEYKPSKDFYYADK